MNTNRKSFGVAGIGLALLSLSTTLKAQTYTVINNFMSPFDYVANGIVGDTNWDGIYLNLGDIPNNGDVGGNGAAVTAIANSAITYPGYLSFRDLGTDWAGGDNDGVFLWKYVAGDFDVSIQSSPFDLSGGLAYDNRANNFSGLMARAYRPDNTGAPYNATNNAYTENYEMIWRFQEFGLNEVNDAVNGARIEHTFPDSNTDTTNTTRYYRIVRSALTNFTFFTKTNLGDPWHAVAGTLVRPLLVGPLQVGVAHAAFSTANRDAVFTDFELTTTNPYTLNLPGAPSALVTTATNIGGSLTFSWTVGDPVNDSSLVVVRANGHILSSPVQGVVYTANTAYGTVGTALPAANEYVVYNGTGNSVTVTNLGGYTTLYTVAVYEYSNPAAPVYNTASPATNTFAGPGLINGVIASVAPTNVPVGGAALASLFATFSSGAGQQQDESASATWTSSDPTIAFFNGNALSALTTGSVTVTGSFGGFNASQVINIHAPAFTDNFGVSQDYIANGLEGSAWDGLFLNFGDVPNPNNGPDVINGQTLTLDANVSTNNQLSFSGLGGSWRSAGNDGMFLHKIVTGDFEVSVHINGMNTLNFNAAGVMARLFFNQALGPVGGGGGAGGSETHVEWWKIQGLAGALSRRYSINGLHTGLLPGSEQPGLNTTDTWLLMQRVNSTNFFFYESSTGTNWFAVPGANCVIAGAASNAPMEVGLSQEMRQSTIGTVRFDTLMIDGPGINNPNASTPLAASGMSATLNNDLTMTFHWVATDATGTNPVRSCLVMRAGAPVTAQPTAYIGGNFGANTWSFGTGPTFGGSNYIVFVTTSPAASTNVSTTVTGLTPGVIYYAAVYTFIGSGGTKNFNAVLPPSGATATIQDGALLFLEVQPLPSIPLGGAQIIQVIGHYQGGGILNVSSFSTIISTNSAVVATTNGVASGMGLGSTTLKIIYGGQTNFLLATVRSPTFNDEFNVTQDYVANRTTGSSWDGVYLNQGDVPETAYVGAGMTTVADANISSNNVLTVTNISGGWAGAQNDGFFLFKYVPGDFQAAVHVLAFQVANYQEAGILARLYSTGTNGEALGAPFAIGTTVNDLGNTVVNAETWVGFTKFDLFNIGTYGRKNLANHEYQNGQNNQNSPDNWLLLLRQNFTNFFFLERAVRTEPWRLTPARLSFSGSGALPDFTGRPLQVGIQVTPYTANPLYAQFEHYMLDEESGLPLYITLAGSNVILSWGADPNAVLQYTSSLSSPNWQPVVGTPTLGVNGYSLSLPVGAGPVFFRLAK